MSRWQSHIDQILGDARARAAGQDSAQKTASAPSILSAAQEAADALDYVAHQDPSTGGPLGQFFVEKAALAPKVTPTQTTGEQAEPPRKTGTPAASPTKGSRPAVSVAPAGQMPEMPISQQGGGLVSKKAAAAGAGKSPPAQQGTSWTPIAKGPQDDPQSWTPDQWTPANAKVASQAEGTTLFDIVMQGRAATKEASEEKEKKPFFQRTGDPAEAGSSGLGRSIKRTVKGVGIGGAAGGVAGGIGGALLAGSTGLRPVIGGAGGALAGGALGGAAGSNVGAIVDLVKKYRPHAGREFSVGHGHADETGPKGLKKAVIRTLAPAAALGGLGALAGHHVGGKLPPEALNQLGLSSRQLKALGAAIGGTGGALAGGTGGSMFHSARMFREAKPAKSSEKKAMSPAQYVAGQDSGAAPSANEGSLTQFLASNDAAVGYTKRDAKLPTRARIKEIFQNVDDPANGEAARAAFPNASAKGGLKVASSWRSLRQGLYSEALTANYQQKEAADALTKRMFKGINPFANTPGAHGELARQGANLKVLASQAGHRAKGGPLGTLKRVQDAAGRGTFQWTQDAMAKKGREYAEQAHDILPHQYVSGRILGRAQDAARAAAGNSAYDARIGFERSSQAPKNVSERLRNLRTRLGRPWPSVGLPGTKASAEEFANLRKLRELTGAGLGKSK